MTTEKEEARLRLEKWTNAELPALMSTLGRTILNNERILSAVCSITRSPPVLAFLATVHEDVLQGKACMLARHYPSAGGSPCFQTLESDFLEYVLPRLEEIIARANLRSVQTNEPRRAAVVPFLLARLHQTTGTIRCALLELGASTGLNLLFDSYSYSFQLPVPKETRFFQGKETEPVFDVEWRSGMDLEEYIQKYGQIEVTWRRGIDLNPNPPAKWLEALVWPEKERMQQFRSAMKIRKQFPWDLVVEGDFTQPLDGLCGSAPEDSMLLIVAPFTLYQVETELRNTLNENLKILSLSRDVFFCTVDTSAGHEYSIVWNEFKNGKLVEKLGLGNCHFHMKWIDLFADPKKITI